MSILSLFEGKGPKEVGELMLSDVSEFVRLKVKEALDSLLEGEIEAMFTEAFLAKNKDFRNGYYYRRLKTSEGVIEVRVPRDRLNLFKTQLLKPYRQVTDDMDYMVQSLYFKGLSQNEVIDYVSGSMGVELSRETISRIVRKLMSAAEAFRTRPLPRCSIVYLDGTYVPLKRRYSDGRCYVEKECIEVAIGVTESGEKEVLGFYPAANEGSESWRCCLDDMRSRGIGEPRLFITDGLNGLDDAIKAAFPSSRHQRCVVHVQRNLMTGVRRADRKAVCADFKDVYSQPTLEAANERMDRFVNKWAPSYPRVCRSLLEVDDLLTFYDFPQPCRQYTRTSNAIESFNALLKRHSRKRILFNGEDNASLVIVQLASKCNSDWRGRLVPFIKELSEEERDELGLCIMFE